MSELLAPAGSMEGVRAAVQSGANAVYLGFGTFNARRGAKNFSREEMAEAIRYCRARGVKTNVTFNIVALDREREAAMEDVRFLNQVGADALIVQDLGLARLIRRHAPELPIHASTQMTVNTLDGAKFAKSLGFSRVVLSRECTLDQIKKITAESGLETEVFIHGALCMCYSGQCFLSAVIGQRSGNRGLCAQPCRLPYHYGDGKTGYPLSLKDLCLAGHLPPLVDAGVASFKIEGRMKRPEYTAIVTQIYAQLLRERRGPTHQEADALRRAFSRDGFTDGYLTGQKGDAMFGTKTEIPLGEVKSLYDQAAYRFEEGREAPLVPIKIEFCAGRSGLDLAVKDEPAEGQAHIVYAQDNLPIEEAEKRASTEQDIEKALRKTGGTPFKVESIKIGLAEGLMVPAARLNALRRTALNRLLEVRGIPPARKWNVYKAQESCREAQAFQGYTVEVRTLEQVTDDLLRYTPKTLYVPLSRLATDLSRTIELCGKGIEVAAVLPRIFTDSEKSEIQAQLKAVRQAGVTIAMVGNLGQIGVAHDAGFTVYGDFGLNVCNSDALAAAEEFGIARQTLSFELRLPQIRDMVKPVQTELLIYGYLPLMIFENCAIRRKAGGCSCTKGQTYLTDRKGARFALLPENGCRNTLLNSQPLYLGDKPADFQQTGISFGRLRFTVESPAQCAQIYTNCLTADKLSGQPVTRGLYYRGVE